MGCCDDKLKKTVGIASKAVSIVKGNAELLSNTLKSKLFFLQPDANGQAEIRKQICRDCDESTWLTAGEYMLWLKDHGFEVIQNLDDLTVLEKLPKSEYGQSKKLFCRLCKCWLPAKAAVKDEKCPLDKWLKEQPAQ